MLARELGLEQLSTLVFLLAAQKPGGSAEWEGVGCLSIWEDLFPVWPKSILVHSHPHHGLKPTPVAPDQALWPSLALDSR